MRQGIANYAATGARVSLPHFRGLLAEILIAHGDYEEAEAELSTAFSDAAENKEPVAEIDLWRLRAEMADINGQRKLALQAAKKAVDFAEEKGAFGPGLRAAISFHLLLDGAAGSPLKRFVGHFPPGAQTPDLEKSYVLIENH